MVYVHIFHVVFSITYLEFKHIFPPNVHSRKESKVDTCIYLFYIMYIVMKSASVTIHISSDLREPKCTSLGRCLGRIYRAISPSSCSRRELNLV